MKDYGKNTSTSILRKHLLSCHEVEWFQSCDKLKIEIGGDEAKAAYARFHDHPAMASSKNIVTRVPYSPEALVDALAELISGDDLVRIIRLYSLIN